MYINMKTCVHLNAGRQFKGVLHCGGHEGEENQDYINNGVQRVAWFEANPNLISTLKQKTSNTNIDQYYYNVCLSDIDGEKITFNFLSTGFLNRFSKSFRTCLE